MKLQYRAVGKDGKMTNGVLEATDKKEATGILRARGFTPVFLGLAQEDIIAKYFSFLNKVTNKEIVFFTRQLSSMLASGLTLVQAVIVLRDQAKVGPMKDMLVTIITDIQGGATFSSAIEKYPAVFSPVYVSLIKTAETSGLLDKVLLRLADNLEKQQKLRGAIKSALTYPVIVIIGMIVVIFVMMIFVVPQLTSLYDTLGIQLPLMTRIVVSLSDLAVNFWWLFIIIVVGFVVGLQRWHKSASGKAFLDTLILKIPIFGKLIRETILAQFSSTFGLLIGSGALVVQSLQQASDVTGNTVFKEAVVEVSARVEKGVTVGDAMSAFSLFPPLLVQMVKVGETTGKLDEALLRVSEYFEREVDMTVKTLTTALEPIIMVVLGIVVAFLIIAIITPIYSLTNTL